MSLLKLIDIYGTPFSFTTYGSEKFSTRLGGVLTLLSVAGLIVFTFLFGRDFFWRTNPRMLSQTVVPENFSEPFNLNDTSLLLPFRFENFAGDMVDVTDLIYFKMNWKSFNKVNGTWISAASANLRVKSCDSVTKNNTKFKDYNMSQFMCLDWTENGTNPYSLGGSWSTDYVNYMTLAISFCPNLADYSNGANCTDYDKVLQYMTNTGLYISMLYPLSYVNPNSDKTPLDVYYTNYLYKLDLILQKTDRLYMKQSHMLDDQGWITRDPIETKRTAVSQHQSDFGYTSKELSTVEGAGTAFYAMNIYADKNYDDNSRSFMKIQELMALVGGFMKFITISMLVINLPFNLSNKNEFYFNELFNFDTEQSKFSKIPSKRIKVDDEANTKPGSSPDVGRIIIEKDIHHQRRDIYEDRTILQKAERATRVFCRKDTYVDNADFKKLDQSKTIRRGIKIKNNNFSYRFSLRYMFCNNILNKPINDQRTMVYSKADNYIKDRLDVIYYLKTLETIDRIRLLMFNQFQNMSIDYLRKPNLFNDDELALYGIEFDKNHSKNANDLVAYYNTRIQENDFDETDRILFSLLDPDIAKYTAHKE